MRVLSIVSFLLWGFFGLIGWPGLNAIAGRAGPGHPNAGQILYYLLVPCVMAGLSLALFFAAPRVPVLRGAWMLPALMICALLSYLVPYSGGV